MQMNKSMAAYSANNSMTAAKDIYRSFKMRVSRNAKRSSLIEFQRAFSVWLPVRDKCISELQDLHETAVETDKILDTGRLYLKKGSIVTKEVSIDAGRSSQVDFHSSIGSLLCDFVGTLTSVGQMINTDSMQSSFRDIMDHDSKATNKMYEVRGVIVDGYDFVEEIIRNFGGTTLYDTLCKISKIMGINDFMMSIEESNGNREYLYRRIYNAVNSASGSSSMQLTREAIQDLAVSNPSSVETLFSAGKSLYGVMDVCLAKREKDGIVDDHVRVGRRAIKRALMQQERREVQELENKIACSESHVGQQIQLTLDMLVKEKQEMLELLEEVKFMLKTKSYSGRD